MGAPLNNKNNLHHGLYKSKLYKVWSSMKDRCNNTKHKFYHRYGGRGITVCKEWNESAVSFILWAKNNGYSEGLYLDRENNDGNYEPSNCRWATPFDSNKNKCNTKLSYEKYAQMKMLYDSGNYRKSEIARMYGIDRSYVSLLFSNKYHAWKE